MAETTRNLIRPRPTQGGLSFWLLGVFTAVTIGVASAYGPAIALGILLGGALLIATIADLSSLVVALVLLHMLGQPWQLSNMAFEIGGFAIFPNDVVTLILLAAAIARGLRSGAVPSLPRDPVAWSAALFFAWGVLSTARSLGIHGWAAILGFRQQFFYSLLYFLLLPVMAERRARRRLLIAVLAAGVVVGLLGLWNVVTGTPAGNMTGSRTFRFLFLFQAMTLFFALALVVGVVWVRWRPFWTYGLAALYLFGIIISQARSLWLGGAAGVLAGAIGSAQWRRITLRLAVPLAVLTIVATLVGGSDSVGDYVTRRAESLGNVQEDATWVWRLFVWGEAMKKTATDPIFGLGLGEPFIYFNVARNQWESDRQIHNSYIEIAYFTGIPGAALYAGFQIFVLWQLLAAARRHARSGRGATLGALACCQICLMGVTFANVVSASMIATTYTWILGAIGMLEVRDADREERHPLPGRFGATH